MQSLQEAIRRQHLGPLDRAVLIHDLDTMLSRLRAIQEAFPDNALHAVAIKANPVVGILKQIVQAGAGLEAASWEEVQLAVAAGCPADRIVYDSPAKTQDEVAWALQLGVRLNADNLEELDRIQALEPKTGVGARLNPQVGAGSIAMTSVSQRGSKFGIALEGLDLPALFARYPFLSGLHVHVGSQGCPLPQLVDGVARVWRAGQQVKDRLRVFDIGGGLPVDYRGTGQLPGVQEYTQALRQACPDMWDFPLITEFGRWVQGPSGCVASMVEYVKPGEPNPQAVLHVGADMLLRIAYHPETWYHRMEVLDAQGRSKASEPLLPCDLVGPLCFGGDVLARGLSLPPIEPGDWVVVHDTGAYTMGMWSRHCSRALPLVLGWKEGQLIQLKARESLEDVVRFWS